MSNKPTPQDPEESYSYDDDLEEIGLNNDDEDDDLGIIDLDLE